MNTRLELLNEHEMKATKGGFPWVAYLVLTAILVACGIYGHSH